MKSKITARKEPIMARFCGAGFHNSEAGLYRKMSDRQFNEVVGKIYRELSPGFTRMWGGAPNWTKEEMDDFAEYCEKTHIPANTSIYLTGHTTRHQTQQEKEEYARNVADKLDYLINEKGIKNIEFYCMSNELSIEDWGNIFFELPVFKDYHTYLYREFKRRNLPVKLLATDASPYERWESIDWAISNGMVPISEIFGGHHYVNDFEPQDLDFYKVFYKNVKKTVKKLLPYERRFILGEFGLAQDMNNVNGVKMDVCKYFYDGQEAYSALMITEMALAAINAGVYACALWTFTDYPNPKGTDFRYNKWGLTKWDGDDYSPRDWLYCYGLIAKYFNKDSKPLTIETEDYYLRCGGVSNDDGSFSIAIVNRHEESTDITVSLKALSTNQPMRKYVYDSANVPRNKFGDMQSYTELISVTEDTACIQVPANSVTLLTTDYINRTPCTVEDVSEDNGMIRWSKSTDPYFCYYRIYKGDSQNFVPSYDNQIASTIVESYRDESGVAGFYKVKVVDRFGNV
ncbi:hypothetical protein RBG61_08720 [Paludicola sp. MB14-C6]|uniref:hypothetical protein n=1 Tax=Paludihabitans sp. MB14-C6 TaxID=3070656 RepID=UPI0027DCA575|nr:hypothetical protein [Paludicola sp. MB14-C6]WMJ22082.1 hypothetical protein RBG61_08720 [Paludicola sp. MB14-C6]